MSRVLVVDDKELMRDSVGAMLTRAGWTVQAAPDGPSALKCIKNRRPDVVVTDLSMPGMDGLQLLKGVREIDEQLPVVLMTAYATVQTAVDAMKTGAFDYLTKPFDGDELVLTIKRAAEHATLMRENAVLRTQLGGKRAAADDGPLLIGDSAAMSGLKQQIDRIASSHGTVLISGESGVGKEVVARTIHAISPRSAAPMLAVNCAALSTTLLESELFGHERGAFTGADRMRKGRFELADGGTLLLDEISEIKVGIQAKLLRVLQERHFERVGSSVTQRTDVRVIATTNRNLSQFVSDGHFRQDLYFRLNVLPIEVPPLRARCEDLPQLCAHFLGLIAEREGREPQSFDVDALASLQRYNWPGNVRELFNICERACIFTSGSTIPASVIEPWLGLPASSPTPSVPVVVEASHTPAAAVATNQPGCRALPLTPADVAPPPPPAQDPGSNGTETHAITPPDSGPTDGVVPTTGRSLEEIERQVILTTLNRHQGHRQRTAVELGIGVRTLGLKLRKWKDLQLIAEDV